VSEHKIPCQKENVQYVSLGNIKQGMRICTHRPSGALGLIFLWTVLIITYTFQHVRSRRDKEMANIYK